MSYRESLERLYALSPKGIELGLDRVRAAAAALGHPETKLRSVQVAGTNGKGTVASLVAHGARHAGLTVGLFTSPHLHRFTQRMSISGDEVSEDVLGSELHRVLDLVDRHGFSLTFFEVATLAALGVFITCKVDLAVLEVGLGGRLDATSIVTPEVCAITSIGLEHMELLGTSLGAIAREKASIAKKDVPLVTGALPEEASRVVAEIAREQGAPLRVLARDFQLAELLPPWPGAHNRQNLAIALEIVDLLGRQDGVLSGRVLLDNLDSVRWPGRFELIGVEPTFLLDCAHNLDATAALAQALMETSIQPEAYVFGGLKDKPLGKMIDLLVPRNRGAILVPPPISRCRNPSEYARASDSVASNVGEGLRLARNMTPPGGVVLVTGSVFTVAEARRILLGEKADPPIGL